MHLGDLGHVHEEEEPLTFGYFGKVYRTNPALADLELVDLVERLIAAQGKGGFALLGILKDMLRSLVHPDDVDAVWVVAKENRQSADDIADMAEQIIEAVVDRPTVRPSDSSDGSQDTAPNSGGGSSSLVVRHFEREGRPDLALLVLETEEYHAEGARSA